MLSLTFMFFFLQNTEDILKNTDNQTTLETIDLVKKTQRHFSDFFFYVPHKKESHTVLERPGLLSLTKTKTNNNFKN